MAERADDARDMTGGSTIDTGPTKPPPEPEIARFSYHGRAGALAALTLGNVLLTVITLGVYRFWARARYRAYFWRSVRFLGDHFEYTGTGLELFLGFLIALVVIVPLAATPTVIELFVAVPFGPLYAAPLYVVFFVLVYFLIGFATFRARRYRLSRTAWRGIRAGQSGSAVRYALMMLGYTLLTMVTLGLTAPLATVRLQRYAMGHTWFGDQPMVTDYSAKDLFRRYIIYWLFLLPSLGLTYVWYSAAKFRYLADRTRLDQLAFGSDLGGGRLFRVVLGYFAILVVFFLIYGAVIAGAFVPVFLDINAAGGLPEGADQQYILRQLINPVSISVLVGGGLVLMFCGSLAVMVFFFQPLIRALTESVQVTVRQDFSTLQQSTQPAPRSGEGLADSFDLSSF